MSEIVIPRAFKFLRTPKRYKAAYGGRGSGKSHAFARTLLIMGCEKPMRIVCAREIQKSIKDSVHQLLTDIIESNPALKAFYQVLETEIRGKNGTMFLFRGLKHNTTDLKSLEGADILWIEEAENVSDRSYEIVIPTIRKEGSEIWASFNVKNVTDPTYRRFITEAGDDTIAVKVSWRDNPFFPNVLRKEKDKLEKTDRESYLHIWEGEPDTRRNGAIYAKQLAKARDEKRICRVPYDPSSEVFTAWDLGYADSTAIWFLQWVGRELRWIDFYENNGESLEHYAKLVKSKPYNYGAHYLPHDGGRNDIRGDSVQGQLERMGVSCEVLERDQSINSGIDAMRDTFAYSVFDAENCKDGLHALEHYAYEYDEDKGRFKDRPRHDWTSHAADAARYAAAAAKEMSNTRNVAVKMDTPTGMNQWAF